MAILNFFWEVLKFVGGCALLWLGVIVLYSTPYLVLTLIGKIWLWIDDQRVDTSTPMPDFTPPPPPPELVEEWRNRPSCAHPRGPIKFNLGPPQKSKLEIQYSYKVDKLNNKKREWIENHNRAIHHQRQAAKLGRIINPLTWIKLLRTSLRALEEKTRPDPS